MKKIMSLLLLAAFAMVLAACGEKSQEDVIEALDKNLDDLQGYKATASMTLQTGKEPQTYEVDVWYQYPTFYRVALSNAESDQSQIILRNDEGVFVLTPALNKSFRFQSDWPENNSQVYLYESLVNDILMDPERTFTATDEHYVFQTNTNYTNKNLNQQEIMLDKKSLTPTSVRIMDVDLETLVEVNFSDFELNSTFDEGDFDMDRNMTGAQLNSEVPTMGGEGDGESVVVEEEGAEESDEEMFTVFFPMYSPQGTAYNESRELDTENGRRVILSYDGEQPFTLVQQRSREVTASTPVQITDGSPVDLGFTIGAISRDGNTTNVSWSYEGTDFFLASQHLSDEEMLSIARSVYGTEEK
ncbi:outer membrane lipoprotein carrier protein LolA [Bacillus sp. H-16]|uniref:LolA family protein n=1 Tax=Alteribacter salitolerans TaxID=2912333 RepID=UPI0019624836|nr:outer membrane lipoprotein carrier protein LolA [Alteribacter salitolerans]MBM7096811.1 outer membrane lipoprotein carrier protein LolA [Alteribacter salitolerans]